VANQKIIKIKKKTSQRHIGEFGELDGGGVYSRTFFFYKGANQTENFTRMKTGNDIYYKGENTINSTNII